MIANKKLCQEMVDRISQMAQCLEALGIDTQIIMVGVRQANFDLALDALAKAEIEQEQVIHECLETIRQSVYSSGVL